MGSIDRVRLEQDLHQYITENLLGDARESQLSSDTPLLEWGVLNSLNLVRLLAYIRDGFGVAVPPALITGQHFRNLRAIADLVYDLSLQPA
ncbi:acyl carrier protein [Micromonospora sp. WMMD723]|uniref:acyl carrier protein n=1 Tax=unclassified Micromonospora TaxID=2617518 RepID=UPI003B946536